MHEGAPKLEVVEGGLTELGELFTEVMKSLPEDLYERINHHAVHEHRGEVMEWANTALVDYLKGDELWNDEHINLTAAVIDVVKGKITPVL